MNFENEITVLVNSELNDIKEHLSDLGFKVMEEYCVNDIYMINKCYVDNEHSLELLKKCVLIRNVIDESGSRKFLTYKYKEYNDKEEIIKQGKINVKVDSIDNSRKLLEALNFEKLISINDNLTVYSNGVDEIVLQCVNNKHIYIEIEDKCNYIDKKYNSIEEMIDVIKKYNIPIKDDNYFVKKAYIELSEVYK